MDNDEIYKHLEKKIADGYQDLSEQGVKRLNRAHSLANATRKELLNSFSNEVRNLGIVAGIVAPFSLSLLTVEGLAILPLILIAGFCVLLAVIGLSQYFAQNNLRIQHKNLIDIEMDLLSADFNREMMLNQKDPLKQAESMFDFVRHADSADRNLTEEILNQNLIRLRSKNLSQAKILFYLLIVGLSLLAISVIAIPAITLITRLVSYAYSVFR
jgi:hypothetical protein